MKDHSYYMEEAINLSQESIENDGGPFGAVIVKSGKIIAKSANSVTKDNDPTAHAEVNVIREACTKLGTFNLKGCIIYTSCEPCPMCLSAIYWAHIDEIYYANTKEDAASIEFDDSFIYKEIKTSKEKRKIPIRQMMRNKAYKVFENWKNLTEKTEY